MDKYFEKFRKFRQCIAEKNNNALTDILTNIISINEDPFSMHRFKDVKCFEYTTNKMIANELSALINYDENCFDSKDIVSLCADAMNVFGYPRWISNPVPSFSHLFMSYIKRENRSDALKLIIKQIIKDNGPVNILPDVMTQAVWYAAFEDDDVLLENICIWAENSIVHAIFDYMILDWTWMYLEIVIGKNRFDLLDRMVSLILSTAFTLDGNCDDFTKLYKITLSDMSYSEMFYLISKRCNPEMSDAEIVEKLLNSKHFENMMLDPGGNKHYKAELDFIMKLNFRTNYANCVIALWMISEYKLQKDYLYSLLADKPVLYLNDIWTGLYDYKVENGSDKNGFLQNFLKDIPHMVLSIDNTDAMTWSSMNIDNLSLSRIFAIRKPVITDDARENTLLYHFFVTNNKKLYTLLRNLIMDEEIKNGLIELCVGHKNYTALNILTHKKYTDKGVDQ